MVDVVVERLLRPRNDGGDVVIECGERPVVRQGISPRGGGHVDVDDVVIGEKAAANRCHGGVTEVTRQLVSDGVDCGQLHEVRLEILVAWVKRRVRLAQNL